MGAAERVGSAAQWRPARSSSAGRSPSSGPQRRAAPARRGGWVPARHVILRRLSDLGVYNEGGHHPAVRSSSAGWGEADEPASGAE